MKAKLEIPEFVSYIQSVDVFTCLETHCDEFDSINFANYECYLKNRSQKCTKNSGGISTFIKQDLASYFTVIETDSEYVQWFKLSKVLFNTDQDVIFGAVYVPPESLKVLNILPRVILILSMLKSKSLIVIINILYWSEILMQELGLYLM